MKTGIQVQILLIASAMGSAANAIDFQAYAPVVNVEPVVETRYEPVTRRVCSEPDAAAREFSAIAATIGEDIRSEARRWQQQQRCRTVTEQRAREDIAGYRVTYRYGGRTSTTRLSYDPGKQMPVNVNLAPLK